MNEPIEKLDLGEVTVIQEHTDADVLAHIAQNGAPEVKAVIADLSARYQPLLFVNLKRAGLDIELDSLPVDDLLEQRDEAVRAQNSLHILMREDLPDWEAVLEQLANSRLLCIGFTQQPRDEVQKALQYFGGWFMDPIKVGMQLHLGSRWLANQFFEQLEAIVLCAGESATWKVFTPIKGELKVLELPCLKS